jgi:hypothetical protein
MSRREMKNRPFEVLQWETSWGRINVEGRKLSVYDETILLCILSLMKKRNTGYIETTRHELCKIAGIPKGKNTYNAIWESIKRLTGTRIDYEKWANKSRKETKPEGMTGTILSGGLSLKDGRIKVSVNEFFVNMFMEGMFTNINLEFWQKLKTDTAKAIYRFLSSQRPFYQKNKYEIHLLKLTTAINITTGNKPLYETRRQIRNGLKELRQNEFIKRWMVNKQDIVTVWK